nr:ATP synthase F0 subunit 6 [Peloridium hammoniorum]
MMNSLFSSFDPLTCSKTQINWMSSFIILGLLPCCYWLLGGRIFNMMQISTNWLNLELKSNMKSKFMGSLLVMTSFFLFIFLNNILGLFPYIFTSSSHMLFSLTLSFPLWLSYMLFGWLNMSKKMFSHLVPEGTPLLITPLVVMIETVSISIRPSVLALRLSANLMVGHSLMSLLGNNLLGSSSYIQVLMIFSQSLIMLFEMFVAVLQAFVFSMLISLYYEE